LHSIDRGPLFPFEERDITFHLLLAVVQKDGSVLVLLRMRRVTGSTESNARCNAGLISSSCLWQVIVDIVRRMRRIHTTDGLTSKSDCRRKHIPRFRGGHPGACLPPFGVVHALNAAEEAPAVTELLSGISALFARCSQGSFDELDQGPPLERLFQESDRAAL
jgi:hypothetical protein